MNLHTCLFPTHRKTRPSRQAQDELDEVKNKESRQRVQMLDELTSLTEEASSLRTQLRAAQRKLAAAANARV